LAGCIFEIYYVVNHLLGDFKMEFFGNLLEEFNKTVIAEPIYSIYGNALQEYIFDDTVMT
jgi:hypothetical protein